MNELVKCSVDECTNMIDPSSLDAFGSLVYPVCKECFFIGLGENESMEMEKIREELEEAEEELEDAQSNLDEAEEEVSEAEWQLDQVRKKYELARKAHAQKLESKFQSKLINKEIENGAI